MLIKLFRFAKLSENAGYGIDKMLTWEKLTHNSVEFSSDLVCSTVTYFRGDSSSKQKNAPENHPENHLENHSENHTEKLTARQLDLLSYIKDHPNTSIADIVKNVESATAGGVKHNIEVLKQKGLLVRIGPDKGGHWEVVED